jgi:hypothetical protein
VTTGKQPKLLWFGAPENPSGRKVHAIDASTGGSLRQPEPGRMIEAIAGLCGFNRTAQFRTLMARGRGGSRSLHWKSSAWMVKDEK